MAQYYLSAVEFIKERRFDVFVPAFYHANISEELLRPQNEPRQKINRFKMVSVSRRCPTPFYQPLDHTHMQCASYSTEDILKMFHKKVEFELRFEEDVVHIVDGIDRYLRSLKDNISAGDEHSIEYARLCVRFREEMYKHYYRYMQLNPAAKEKLYPNHSPTQNVFHLMGAVSGREDRINLDPLRAKAEPPINIDKLLPQNKVDADPEYDMQTSLGLSNENNFQDDIADFKLDDFLKR